MHLAITLADFDNDPFSYTVYDSENELMSIVAPRDSELGLLFVAVIQVFVALCALETFIATGFKFDHS